MVRACAEAFRSLPVHRPGAVLAAVLAVTALLGAGLVDLRSGRIRLGIDASLERLLPDGDETHRAYARMLDQFGGDEMLLIAVVVDDLFTPTHLTMLRRVSDAIGDLEGVERVLSLATAEHPIAGPKGLEARRVLETIPEDPEALRRLRETVASNPLLMGTLVSRDARAASLVVHLDKQGNFDPTRTGVDEVVAAVAARESGGAEIWVTGPSRIEAATARGVVAEQARIIPLTLALAIAIALVSFRSLRAVVLPVATAGIALCWTLGAVTWLGVPLNTVTMIIPAVVLSVGLAYTVHVVSDYQRALVDPPAGVSRDEGPVAIALHQVWLAVVVTGGTTAVGFLALCISPIRSVREFGWIAALGVLATLVASLTFLPAALQLLGPPPRMPLRADGSRTAAVLARGALRHRTAVLLVGGLLAATALAAIPRIEVNTDLVTNFPEDHPLRVQFQAYGKALGGARPFSIALETEWPATFLEAENLRELEELQRWLEAQPGVGGTTSVADAVRVVNRALGREGVSLPDDPSVMRKLAGTARSEVAHSFVTDEYRSTRILVRSQALSTREVARLVERIEARLATLPDTIEATVTGRSVVLARAVDDLAAEQMRSLGAAAAGILVVLVLLFGSLRMGLVALVPNVLPIVFYFGVLGFAGISLNPTTALVACVVLGIAVDDTVHLMTRCRAEAHRGPEEAVVQALRMVWRPVSVTTAVLCAGFLVLATGEMRNQAQFGALSALTLAFAWLVDVTFAPALCARIALNGRGGAIPALPPGAAGRSRRSSLSP